MEKIYIPMFSLKIRKKHQNKFFIPCFIPKMQNLHILLRSTHLALSLLLSLVIIFHLSLLGLLMADCIISLFQ